MKVLEREEELNHELKQKVSQAENQNWIERQIRNKLNLVKPGEVMVLVESADSEATGSQKARELPPLEQWWRLFWGK